MSKVDFFTLLANTNTSLSLKFKCSIRFFSSSSSRFFYFHVVDSFGVCLFVGSLIIARNFVFVSSFDYFDSSRMLLRPDELRRFVPSLSVNYRNLDTFLPRFCFGLNSCLSEYIFKCENS